MLTHRVAWLVQVEGASPHGILAVTFTNKAAGEMRSRIESMLGVPSAPLWIGTFHGIAHRLLRIHWRDANLPQSFQIMDAEDQLRAIRRLLKAQDLDEDTHRPFWAEDRVTIPEPPRNDAGTPACVPLHGECASGVCCAPNTCTPDANGRYTCEVVVPG